MGFRIRKSVKIAPDVRINFSKKGIGYTVGSHGITYSSSPFRRTSTARSKVRPSKSRTEKSQIPGATFVAGEEAPTVVAAHAKASAAMNFAGKSPIPLIVAILGMCVCSSLWPIGLVAGVVAVTLIVLLVRAGRTIVAPKTTVAIAAICLFGAVGFAVSPSTSPNLADADPTKTAAASSALSYGQPEGLAEDKAPSVSQAIVSSDSMPLLFEPQAEPVPTDYVASDESVPEDQLWSEDFAYEEPAVDEEPVEDGAYGSEPIWEEPVANGDYGNEPSWEEPSFDAYWEEPAEESHVTVYIAASGQGKRYHTNPGCSNMKGTIALTVDEAIARGKTPCGTCC